jgi:hypothetical protein
MQQQRAHRAQRTMVDRGLRRLDCLILHCRVIRRSRTTGDGCCGDAVLMPPRLGGSDPTRTTDSWGPSSRLTNSSVDVISVSKGQWCYFRSRLHYGMHSWIITQSPTTPCRAGVRNDPVDLAEKRYLYQDYDIRSLQPPNLVREIRIAIVRLTAAGSSWVWGPRRPIAGRGSTASRCDDGWLVLVV